MDASDVRAYNRDAWDREVASGTSPWAVPVTSEQVAAARRGEWSVVLTMTKPVPREWFGDLKGKDVLALASGGGQQAPILAAAGARVTLLDNSPAQLALDRKVAERDGLDVRLVEGNMEDLSQWRDGSFDLVFHPVSNLFTPDVRKVWRECARVLHPGGRLLAGFMNPIMWVFDREGLDRGEFVVRHSVPYSDVGSLPPEELARHREKGWPIEWGHSLADQIGGQIDAGLLLAGFYEDRFGTPDAHIDRVTPSAIATLALKSASR